MWRRAGSICLHLSRIAGRRVRRPPQPPAPTATCSTSAFASSSFHHNLGTFLDSIRVPPSRSLSNQAGGDGSIGGECWSCGAKGAFLSCGSCRSVQPVDPAVDYFRIFGLDRGYDVKDTNLEGKYKDWQKKLHPDLVHSKSEVETGILSKSYIFPF
uniref:J domain-containing protein n=1 Tax=Aegilops tauschii subsp. strangulata TaxID=200361 RepID=A0A453RCA0_AEGTS